MIQIIDLIVTAGIAALFFWLGRRSERQRWRAVLAEEREEAYARGTRHGLNLGWIHHGRAMSRLTGESLHGYSGKCAECGRVYGILAGQGEEYWPCQCGHRNPAPLVSEDASVPFRYVK